jgi:GGDEF domain-containing protein
MTASFEHAWSDEDREGVVVRLPVDRDGPDLGFDPGAERDSLTGLLGPDRFAEAVRGAAQRRRGAENPWIAVAALEGLDGVEAGGGTAARAQLLRATVHRMRDSLREGDRLGRLGENAFGLIVDAPYGDAAMNALQRLVHAGKQLAASDRRWDGVRMSVGVAPLWSDDPDEALARAQEALDRARERGGGIVVMSTALR